MFRISFCWLLWYYFLVCGSCVGAGTQRLALNVSNTLSPAWQPFPESALRNSISDTRPGHVGSRKILLECPLLELAILRILVVPGTEKRTAVDIEREILGCHCSSRSPNWVTCRLSSPLISEDVLDFISGQVSVISISGSSRRAARTNDKFAYNLLVHGRNDTLLRITSSKESSVGGLSGAGVVLASSDTGCDATHCFFEGLIEATPKSLAQLDVSRRKIIQYLNYADDSESWGGHGTLTAGIAVGAATVGSPAVAFEGIAPNAKLVVVDAFNAEDELGVDSYLEYYEQAYAAGARVFSESWGDPKNSYSAAARQIDEFTRRRRDATVVRSTGNNGRLNSECNSKNSISVGATNQVYLGYIDYQRLGLAPWSTEIVCRLYPIACPRAEAGEFNETNVCSSALASALCWKNGTAVGYDLSAPQLVNEWTVSDFSTRGPTRDGRVRPHLVAPGAAMVGPLARPNRSRYSCEVDQYDLWLLEGTSFSTPAVAGLAALVVELWRRGGLESVPSSLVRATLVTSASFPEDLNGIMPSNSYGYGLPRLSILEPYSITLVSAENITIHSHEARTLCFTSLTNCTADVVFTWTDAPAVVDSSAPLSNTLLLSLSGLQILRNFSEHAPADNTVRLQVQMIAGAQISITVSAAVLGSNDQDFSLLFRGLDGLVMLLPGEACNQWDCVGSEVVPCTIPDGIGQQLCQGPRMGKCRVKTCNTGFFPSHDGTTCKTPILLWQLNLALSGAVLLLIGAGFATLACIRLISCIWPPSTTTSKLFKLGLRWWGVLLGFEGIAYLAVGAAGLFVSNASDLLQPLFVGIAVQEALMTEYWSDISLQNLLIVIGLSVAVWIANTVATFMSNVLFPFALLRRGFSLVLQQLLRLRIRWFERYSREYSMGPVRWAISSRVLPQMITRMFMSGFATLQSAMTSLFVSLFMLGVISWHLLLLLLGMGIFSLMLNIPMGRVQIWLESGSFRQTQEMSDLASDFFMFFDRWYVSQSAKKLSVECAAGFLQVYKKERRKAVVSGILSSLLQNIQSIGLPTTVFWFGIYLMNRGTLSAGIFLSAILYASKVSGGISQLTGIYGLISNVWSYVPKLAAILIADDHALGGSDAVIDRPMVVEFDNVRFSRAGRVIFDGVNLTLQTGMNIVVGASGCGKSTIISLVTRAHIADSGFVRVGASDVRDLRRSELSRILVWLRQHPKFPINSAFSGLCRLVAPQATEDDIRSCAKASGALRWLEVTLPSGPIEQIIPGTISGGQRKSIELSLAHLKAGCIVLADEITSDFDTESAKAALAALDEWATTGSKIVVHVTHDMGIVSASRSERRLIVATPPGKFKLYDGDRILAQIRVS